MSDDRLLRAMRASGAPVRDPAFALLVLERAEKERFRRAGLGAALRGGGMAAAAAAGLLLLGTWASAHAASIADGAVWAAWPKRASGVPTDVTEDVVREVALPLGLVDVKVCAIDETWSGLRLVIRKELR